MSLRDQILALVREPAYRPGDEAAIAKKLGLDRKKKASLTHEVRKLLSTGELTRVQGDRLRWSGNADEIIGTLICKASGKAFFKPQPGSPAAAVEGDILIEDEFTGTALHGDTIAVRMLAGRSRHGDARLARILRVVERARETVVGSIEKQGRHLRIIPDDTRLPVIRVEDTEEAHPGLKPAEGDKVVVHLNDWTDARAPLTGQLTRKLGRQFEPTAELLGVFEKFNLSRDFPEAVEREAAAIPGKVRPQDLAGRVDYREVPTITIDPDDAKDFDDALSLETLPNGDLRVGIHIADVSAYVRPGTALDLEAQKRANSTYLVGTVVPMLPEKLSNGLCSLVEGEDRLTQAVVLTFNKAGTIKETDFARAVIRSRKRLSYRQAYLLLFQNDYDKIRSTPALPSHQTAATGRPLGDLTDLELVDLQSWLRKLWSIAKKLRADRMAKGSLDLDMPETKIFVDAKGYAERLERMVHDESHQLIEEYMLAANEALAHLTRTRKLHSVYRVHDEPDFKKLAEFREFAGTMGLRCGELTRRTEVLKTLAEIDHHPQSYLLKTSLLRSLRKACYRASPDGHYGLNMRDYTHFTSPIRRYADLIVHRVLAQHLGAGVGHPVRLPDRVSLDSIAEHLSDMETNSQEAERESWKIKLLEFFERELAKKPRTRFTAVITEVRLGGLFIELTESMTFGFVKADSFTDDRYERNASGSALVGVRKHRKLTIGQTIEVVVTAVDRQRRMIDFAAAPNT